MKDVKFVFLLFLIIFIGMVNVIWLTKLQNKYNKLTTLKAEDLFNGVVLEAGVIHTKLLNIFDKNNELRMSFGTFGPSASIDIYTKDGHPKFSYYDSGLDTVHELILYGSGKKRIILDTSGFSPEIIIKDEAGKSSSFSSFGPTAAYNY